MGDRTYRGTCARCRRPGIGRPHHPPDGRICGTCWFEATHTTGTCTSCNQHRLLPGRTPEGAATCRDCAGITRNLVCGRCNREWAIRAGLCEWCYLHDRLTDVLQPGPVDLQPLHDHFLNVDRPHSIMMWLTRPHVQALLTGLATETIPLTHDGLDAQQPRPSADHINGLLVAVGLLPPRDPYLVRFDRWVNERLPNVNDPDAARLLTQFARWKLRPGLQQAARRGTGRRSLLTSRTGQLHQAAQLINWLDSRDTSIDRIHQRDIDDWFAGGTGSRRCSRTFLRWLSDTGRLPGVTVPPAPRPSIVAMSQTERLDHLRALLGPDHGPLDSRAAAMILLLYAQTFTTMATLTSNHVQIQPDGHTTILLAHDPIYVPPPFDILLHHHIGNRPWTNTATNHNSDWLFPGRRPDRPMCHNSLARKVRRLGITLLHARAATLADLVTQCPAPVVAQMLGYTAKTTTHHAHQTGATWQRYPTARSSTRR